MAAADAPQTGKRAFNGSVPFDGENHVFGTGWIKATARSEEGGQKNLIDPYAQDEKTPDIVCRRLPINHRIFP